MDFQWTVSNNYSKYTVSFEGRDWEVRTSRTETSRHFDLYDGEGRIVRELPTDGGLYLALDYAQAIITRKIPASFANSGNS